MRLPTYVTDRAAVLVVLAAAATVFAKNREHIAGPGTVLNVSYDPTRELYADLNPRFEEAFFARTRQGLKIIQSHGGSSRQARAVVDGLDADVVTLALASDVDLLRMHGLITEDWSTRLPNHSVPYTSTIVFVVRRGNPAHIADWPDLVRPGISIVTPSPKTSGNGKLALMAAWGSTLRRGGRESDARTFVSALYSHVVTLDPGARAATTAFSEDKIGDVHLTWENEALFEVAEASGDLEVVYPPTSIRAEPSVAWVDTNVARKGSQAMAQAYLEYLFTDEAQEIIAQHGYRPFREDILTRHADRFPSLDLFPVTFVAKDWNDAQRKFFAEGGVFDTLREAKDK
jgi:sulfate transport system substrate-binding protein